MKTTHPAVGLKAKAIIALTVIILAIQSASVVIEDRLFVADAYARLAQRTRLLADLYAGAVSGSVWEYDRAAAEAQLAPLQAELPEFRNATILEPDGKVFASVGAAGAGDAGMTAEAAIHNSGDLIGRIRITASDSVVRADRLAHLRREIAVAAMMAAVLLLFTLAALRLVIRPLERITPLMRSFAVGDLERTVPYLDRTDEVGEMARALDVFRDNASQRLAAERALESRSEELSRVNAELLRARDAAEAANRSKSDFLAAMSHEIRTPLNGIIGMLHLLMSSPLREDQRIQMITLESSAQSLLRLLNDILDIAKIEAGRVDLHVAPFSMREMLNNLVTLWQPSALSKDLALTLSIDAGTPERLIGDANRLGQVIGNYLSNAVKFTERGGIQLSAGATPAGGDLYDVRIAVRDTGPGIAPEMQARLFQKFSQDEVGAARPGSTGLGLAISKQLIHLMNGEVGVGSMPGEGATFWLQVRCRRAESPAAAPASRDPEAILALPGARKIRVLVAEDNAINQRVVCAMLELGGHGATIANDGVEAVAAVQREPFDVVLMDVQMPRMDGPAAAKAIRDLGPDYEALPIVALTANAMPGDRDRYIAAGMTDYLSKPFSPDDLSLALRQAAGGDVARIPSANYRPDPASNPPDAKQEHAQQEAMGALLRDL